MSRILGDSSRVEDTFFHLCNSGYDESCCQNREQDMSDKIDKGGQFPDIELAIAGGGKLRLPADIDTPYAFILFYRGHW